MMLEGIDRPDLPALPRSARKSTRLAQLQRMSRSERAITVRVLPETRRHHEQRLAIVVALEGLGDCGRMARVW